MSSPAVCCQRGFCSSRSSMVRMVEDQRRRGVIKSAVSIWYLFLSSPAPLRFTLVDGPARDHLVKHRLAVLHLAQHAAQTLHVLARSRRAAQHNGNLGFRHVDALVEHT